MNIIEQITNDKLRTDLPDFNIGDTIKVSVKIKEGARERTQVFEGTVIARKNGKISETITVRRISYGVGVERVFLLNSTNIAKIEVTRKGKVRRAKLHYLRSLTGKKAKVREKIKKTAE